MILGNFHKWVFSPKACAVLWVNPLHHAIINPVVTSHFYFEKPFQKNFFMQGTRDLSAQICAKDGIHFFEEMGGLVSEANKISGDLKITERINKLEVEVIRGLI